MLNPAMVTSSLSMMTFHIDLVKTYMKKRHESDYISIFDEKTGIYIRTGIKTAYGRRDPFMSTFPELLDIGIMGHCIHGRTGLCLEAGVECYQDGYATYEENMRLEDFAVLAEQCRGKVYQFALGGRGDPDQHEHFEQILRVCRDCDIVPNYTTSGYGMTKERAVASKKYCGAVAVSWYRNNYTKEAIRLLTEAGVKTNIHYVLNNKTLEEARKSLIENRFPMSINAVVFLLHKPVGSGTWGNVISSDNDDFRDFILFACSREHGYKIGFDSCTVPFILTECDSVDVDSMDACEAGRWSAYISPDLKMMPCSFDAAGQRWAVDLRHCSIQDAWNSPVFSRFRSYFAKACPSCPKRDLCLGGCPAIPEITPCRKRKSA